MLRIDLFPKQGSPQNAKKWGVGLYSTVIVAAMVKLETFQPDTPTIDAQIGDPTSKWKYTNRSAIRVTYTTPAQEKRTGVRENIDFETRKNRGRDERKPKGGVLKF